MKLDSAAYRFICDQYAIVLRRMRLENWKRTHLPLGLPAAALAGVVGVAGALAAPRAGAVDYVWDSNGGTAPNPESTGAGGNWLGAGNWWNGTTSNTWGLAGGPLATGMAAGDTATFQGTAGGTITTNIPNANLNAIALGLGTLIVNSSATYTFNNGLSGSGGSLIKRGAGTLILAHNVTTNNTFGNVRIEQGILRVASQNALGATARTITVLQGGTLELASGGGTPNTTILRLNGTGAVPVGSPPGTLPVGALHIAGTSINSIRGSIFLDGGTTIKVDDSSQFAMQQGGSSVNLGAHTLTLGGNSTGRLVAGGAMVAYDFAMPIRGTGGVIVNTTGTGLVRFTSGPAGGNTYTGQTQVWNGTLFLNGAANNTRQIVGDGTSNTPDLVIGNGTGTATVLCGANNPIANNAEVVMGAGTATFSLVPVATSFNTTIGSLASTNTGAQVRLGTGTLTVSNGNGGSDGCGDTTFDGILGLAGDTGGLTKTRTGTFTLTNANNYGGATNIQEGVIKIQNNLALGTAAGNTTVSSGAALQLQTDALGNPLSVAGELLTLNGAGVANDGALRNLSGDNDWGGAVTLGSASRINSDADTLTIAGNIGGAGQTLTVGGAGDTTVSGVIGTAAGGLTKDGAGTLTLTNTNTYAGTTSVTGGTLLLDFAAGGATEIISGASALSLSGGTLVLKGQTNSQAFNGLTGTGGTLRLDADGATAQDSLTVRLGGIAKGGAYNFTGADTRVNSGIAIQGAASYVTTSVAGLNNGMGRLGASVWTDALGNATWASTAGDGAQTYVVPWQGSFTDLRTDSYTNTPGDYTNTSGDLRILDGSASATAVRYAANTPVGSMLMVAANHSTTVAIDGGVRLTLDDGAGTGAVAIAGTGQSLTLGNAVNQGVVTVGVTVAGGTLSLANTSPTATLAVNAVVADNGVGGPVGLSSNGLVVLNAANTYTGDTGIGPGTLRIAGAGSLGAGNYAGAIANNGTLQYASSAAQTLSGVLSGGGALVKDAGSGNLVLTGANTYSGTTTIGGGTLQVAGTGSLGGGNHVGAIAIGNGATLQYSATNASQTLSGIVSGAGALVKDTGTGVLNLTGANTYSGTTTIGAGTLRIGGAGSLGAGATYAGAIANDGTLQYSSGTGQTLGGVISGSGNLVKDGALSTLTLTGANTYAGTTTLNGGTLLLDFAAGGTSDILYNGVAPAALSLNGGTLQVKGGAAETNSQTFGGLNGTGGTLQLAKNGAASVTLNLGAIANPATAAYNFVGSDAVVSGGIVQPGSTTRFLTTTAVGSNTADKRLGTSFWEGADWASTASDGSQTYVVKWAGNYTNLVTDTNGTDAVAVAPDTQGNLKIANGAGNGVATTYTADQTIASLLMVANLYSTTVAIDPGATLTIDNDNGSTGLHDSGSVAMGSTAKDLTLGGSALGTVQGSVTAGNGTVPADLLLLNLNPLSTLAVNSAIVDNGATGAVSLTTAGKVVLNAANTYTGDTAITGGTLQIAGTGSLGAGATYAGAIANEGTLQYSSTATQTLSGAITGGGGIAKDGIGTLILSGANTYDGATTIATGGAINLRNDSALGSTLGGTTVAAGGALELQNDIAVGNEALALNGDGLLAGGALRNISGDNTFGGDIALASASRVNSDAGTLTLAGDITGAGQSLTVGGAGNTTVSGAIGTAAGTLTKDGLGTLTLTGANTYTGATTITAGTLELAGAGTLGGGDYAGAITDNGLLKVNSSADQILSGAISGGGALTKDNTGTLTLTGANNYLGPTTVDGGTLSVVGSVAGSVAVNAGGTLTGSGTVGATSVAGGTLANNTGSTLKMGTTVLDSNAVTSAGLGAAANPALFAVTGTLTLDGNLSVKDVGGFTSTTAPVVYHLYTYTAALVDQGLAINPIPGVDPGHLFIQTHINGEVNLVNTNGALLSYWDADELNNGLIGGTGTWVGTSGGPGSSPTWTDQTGAVTDLKAPNSFAFFAGTAGTVTVDDTTAGVPDARGLYFETTGYVIGDAVNNGSVLLSNDTGAAILSAAPTVSATINTKLTGNEDVEKTGVGAITLAGNNTYTGSTTVSAGTLAITGSVASARVNIGTGATLEVANGTALADTAAVVSTGAGAFVLSSNETIGSLGGTGTVNLNANTLTTGGNNAGTTYAGVLSGAGGLTKVGTGAFTLAGLSNFAGALDHTAGTLRIASPGAVTAGSYTQASGATLVLDASAAGAPLTVTGNATFAGNVGVLNTTALTGPTSKVLVDVSGTVTGTFNQAAGTVLGTDRSGDFNLVADYTLGDGNDFGLVSVFNPNGGLGNMVRDLMIVSQDTARFHMDDAMDRLERHRQYGYFEGRAPDGASIASLARATGLADGLTPAAEADEAEKRLSLYTTATHHEFDHDIGMYGTSQRLVVGGDFKASHNTMIGGQLGIGTTDWKHGANSGDLTDYRVSLFSQHALPHDLFLDLGAGAGFLDFDTSRGAQVAEPDGWDVHAFARLAWRALDLGGNGAASRLEPYAGVRGVRTSIRAYDESGPTPMHVGSQVTNLGQAFAGVNWTQWFELSQGGASAVGYHARLEGFLGEADERNPAELSVAGSTGTPATAFAAKEDHYGGRLTLGADVRAAGWTFSAEGSAGQAQHTRDWFARLSVSKWW